MKARRRAIVAVTIIAIIGLASVYLRMGSPVSWRVVLEFVPVYLLFPITAAIVIARPTNVSGWCLFLSVGLALLEGFGYLYGLYPGLPVSGSLPLAWPAVLMALALQSVRWAFIPALFLAFPSGRLNRRRAAVAAAAMVVPFAAAALVLLTPEAPYGPTEPAMRAAARTYGPAAETTFAIAWFLFRSFAIGCGAWVLFNLRKGDAVVRQQGKWLLGGTIGVFGLDLSRGLFVFNPMVDFLLWNAALMIFALCMGIAITKYRLFDIDLLISKAVLYAAMAGVITIAYTALVATLGYLAGTSTPSFAVSITGATGAALVLFPLQERLRRYANLLVFGRRATPYEAMSSFSRAIGDVPSHDRVLPAIATAVQQGTGAEWVQVASLLPGAEEMFEVGEPRGAPDETFEVTVSGESVGKIALRKRRGDVLTPTERKLLEDLAAQAGPAVRNVGLALELERRLDEITEQAAALQQSRARLVEAGDAERRRLERDLHDGAQQRLVSLSLAMRMLQSRTRSAADQELGCEVARMADELKRAIDELRDLAHGIHPAALTEHGLGVAIEGLAEAAPIPARVRTIPHTRLPPTVEATAYFTICEAMANAGKHAQATAIDITAQLDGSRLVVEVGDDGKGGADIRCGTGLAGIDDRVAAIGGTLHVDSPAGRGTRIRVDLPCG